MIGLHLVGREEFLVDHERRPNDPAARQFPAPLNELLLPATVCDETVDAALHAQPIETKGHLALRDDMDDHHVAWTTTRGELQEHCQGQANLFTVRDNRLIVAAYFPACVRKDQIGAADPFEHPTDATRGLTCGDVVDK